MKKMISLLKVLVKTNINSMNTKKQKTKLLLLIAFFVYILFIFIHFWQMFIEPLAILEQEKMAIYLILNISSGFVLITSITYVINLLYFTNDMEHLLPFPFKPRELFVAKILMAYIYEWMIATMFVLPGFLAYGWKIGGGVTYYLYAFLVYLFLPAIPITIVTVITTLIMQVVKMGKYKNAFRIVCTILILSFTILFQMKLNTHLTDNGNYDGQYILEVCEQQKQSMPYHLDIAVNAIHQNESMSGLLALGWYILLNLLLGIGTIWAFDRMYMKGVRRNFDVTTTSHTKGTKHYRKHGKWSAFVKKEMRSLMRNVTFFMQCVLPTSFIPAIILISIITSGEASGVNFSSHPTVKMMFGFLIIQFFMMMNQISATAISRDGQQEASIVKTFPITTMRIAQAKAMPSIFVGLFNLMIAMIFNGIVFGFSWVELLELIIGGVLLNFIQSYWFLLLDLKKPKLRWESEISVVKHSANVFKAICLWFGVIILTALIGNLFLILQVMHFGFIMVAMLSIIFVLMSVYLEKNVDKLYKKIY